MGRKGGGRAGFIKSQRQIEQSDEPEEQQPAAAAPPPAAPAAEPAAAPAPGVSSKAAAFLKDQASAAPAPSSKAAAAAAGNDEEEEGSRHEGGESAAGGESRGQLMQRHKREQKALKDQVKRLGKKGKDEAARLEADLTKRQAEELAALEAREARVASGAEAVALADSLYSVQLDGSKGSDKKLTKAQKRREQRLREEAERDARIAAELEAQGDSDRVLEERSLKEMLLPLGLAIREVPADGHCLYRSLEDQLAQLPEADAAALTAAAAEGGEGAEPEELSFLQLRQVAAETLRAHAEHFRPFVLPEDTSEAQEAEDAFEAYCSEVESTAAWGGQVELQALAQALKCHIVVYAVGMPVVELGQEHAAAGRPTLRLCYLRHAYGLGEHYNSVGKGLLAVSEGEGEEDGSEQEA